MRSLAAAMPRLRWPSLRGWLLTASLLGNVFLLAHAAAPMLHGRREPGFAGLVDHFARALPADDAERFHAVLDPERTHFEAARREMDQSRAELSRAIAQTPYDEALVRMRMAEWQAHLQAMAGRIGATLLTALPVLSPEGRARLADAADHPPGPPPGPPPGR